MGTPNTPWPAVFLLALGFAGSAVPTDAAIQTNQVHQQALEVLRKTMEGLEPRGNISPKPGLSHEQTFPEIEKLYLQGKITAKEFQKYLDEHKPDVATGRAADAQTRALEVLREAEAGNFKAAPPNTKAETPTLPEPGINAPVPPDQSTLAELERKMDELVRLKAARESASATNLVSTTSTNVTGPLPPKSKRQRLDDLLKRYIDGKIQDAEYKAQRARLIAGPD